MIKSIAIMQPTFLPWAGYFNLINSVDFFIFLNDVQFEKNGWDNRNRIILNSKEHWITVPVKKTGLNTRICDIIISDVDKWKNNFLSKIKQNYSKHDYFIEIDFILKLVDEFEGDNLEKLNKRIILSISEKLSLKPKFINSTDLDMQGERSEYLIKIIRYFNCSKYYSPVGSKSYIEEDGLFADSNIDLKYQEYIPNIYKQKNSNRFYSHMSIIDVLANIGIKKTKEYII